jgi:indole-3-glycerol phosphate synthase
MRTGISGTLNRIIADTRYEIEQDKERQTLDQLKRMLTDAIPVLSFSGALASGKALIAEIKERSPSQGKMRPENVEDAPNAYKRSKAVKAISVLTSWMNFGDGMRVIRLSAIKSHTGKPVLRKDFIIEEYQVYQARAYGADAILLMANILENEEMRRLSDLAFELGMDVLFETHCVEELDALPDTAKIIGINCRDFGGGLRSNFKVARFFRQWLGATRDRSINSDRFAYVDKLPSRVIKIAESGISAQNCAQVLSRGFHSVLVGTSLLMDPRGISTALEDFESAIESLSAHRESASTRATPA